MAITFHCESCRFEIRVGDGQAGKRGRCPKCKAEMYVPAPPEAAGKQAVEAFDRFFMDGLCLFQSMPMTPSLPGAPSDLARAKAELIEAREEMESALADNIEGLMRLNTIAPREAKADAAVRLFKVGLKVDGGEFELPEPTRVGADAALDSARTARRKLTALFEPFQTAAARRLDLTTALLQDDRVAERVAGGPIRREGARTIHASTAFLANRVAELQWPLMHQGKVLAYLMTRVPGANRKTLEALTDAVMPACSELNDLFGKARRVLRETTETPIVTDDGPLSLSDYLVPAGADPTNPIQMLEYLEHVQDQFMTLYRHLLGRLAVGAEEVEKVLGLGPLGRAV